MPTCNLGDECLFPGVTSFVACDGGCGKLIHARCGEEVEQEFADDLYYCQPCYEKTDSSKRPGEEVEHISPARGPSAASRARTEIDDRSNVTDGPPGPPVIVRNATGT